MAASSTRTMNIGVTEPSTEHVDHDRQLSSSFVPSSVPASALAPTHHPLVSVPGGADFVPPHILAGVDKYPESMARSMGKRKAPAWL